MSEEIETDQNIPGKPAIDSNKNTDKSRKRKRPFVDTLTTAYSSVEFAPRTLTGECRPDSPHFFFSSSYTVLPSDESGKKEETVSDPNKEVDVKLSQVVHQHVNGLCMLTAGELSIPASKTLKSIRYIAKEAPPCSNAEKRKRQAKMLKGRGKVDHIVTPSTVVAELVLEDRTGVQESTDTEKHKTTTTTIQLCACVWGTILELNTALTPEVLLKDPLLDGFIAIILPTGRFPPQNAISKAVDSHNSIYPDRQNSK